MDKRVAVERLAIAALVSTFVLICLGAYVVKIGAGLACPTWPGCFEDSSKGVIGNWIPFLDPDADLHGFDTKHVAAEWTHRLIAGLALLLVAALVAIAWRTKDLPGGARNLAIASGVLFVSQIALGGVTVLLGNAPWTVVLHQGNAMLIFGALVALIVVLRAAPLAAGAPEGVDA